MIREIAKKFGPSSNSNSHIAPHKKLRPNERSFFLALFLFRTQPFDIFIQHSDAKTGSAFGLRRLRS